MFLRLHLHTLNLIAQPIQFLIQLLSFNFHSVKVRYLILQLGSKCFIFCGLLLDLTLGFLHAMVILLTLDHLAQQVRLLRLQGYEIADKIVPVHLDEHPIIIQYYLKYTVC
jgi:hypothetical protein